MFKELSKGGDNKMCKFDYSKLRGRIIEKFGNQASFARAMGISEHSISLKLNGKLPWKQPEIYRAVDVLDLTDYDIPIYFFRVDVQSIEQ